jgi:hypothetical protein
MPAINGAYVDTENPTITVNGTYEKKYLKGSVLTVHGAVFADSYIFADGSAVSPDENETAIRVFAEIGGARVEQTVTDGKITLGMLGKYYVVYTAIDLAGNQALTEYELESVESFGNDPDDGLTGGQIAAIVGGSVACAAAIGAGVFFLLRFLKKKKTA